MIVRNPEYNRPESSTTTVNRLRDSLIPPADGPEHFSQPEIIHPLSEVMMIRSGSLHRDRHAGG